jgi:hypothetical protein
MKLQEIKTRNSQEMFIIERQLEMTLKEIRWMIFKGMRILDSKSSWSFRHPINRLLRMRL